MRPDLNAETRARLDTLKWHERIPLADRKIEVTVSTRGQRRLWVLPDAEIDLELRESHVRCL